MVLQTLYLVFSSFKANVWTSRSQLKREIKEQRGWSERHTEWFVDKPWGARRGYPSLEKPRRRLAAGKPTGTRDKAHPVRCFKGPPTHLNKSGCAAALHSLIWLTDRGRESRAGQHTHTPRLSINFSAPQGKRFEGCVWGGGADALLNIRRGDRPEDCVYLPRTREANLSARRGHRGKHLGSAC